MCAFDVLSSALNAPNLSQILAQTIHQSQNSLLSCVLPVTNPTVSHLKSTSIASNSRPAISQILCLPNMAPTKPAFRKQYNLRSRIPTTLQDIFSLAPIQDAIIGLGPLDRYDLHKLELAGLRARISVEAHERIFTGQPEKCECLVDFQLHPRGLIITGRGYCPNNSITCTRVARCNGSRRHSGTAINWDHEEYLGSKARWNRLNTFRNCARHPPGLGPVSLRMRMCSECLQDAEYSIQNPPQQGGVLRTVTEFWVPFCKSHSLQVYYEIRGLTRGRSTVGPHWEYCHCVREINRGWACTDHRLATFHDIKKRSDHHKSLLKKIYRRPLRSGRRVGIKSPGWYLKPKKEKEDKRAPACPVYACGRRGWKDPRTAKAMARCLGCGGVQSCIGAPGALLAT